MAAAADSPFKFPWSGHASLEWCTDVGKKGKRFIIGYTEYSLDATLFMLVLAVRDSSDAASVCLVSTALRLVFVDKFVNAGLGIVSTQTLAGGGLGLVSAVTLTDVGLEWVSTANLADVGLVLVAEDTFANVGFG